MNGITVDPGEGRKTPLGTKTEAAMAARKELRELGQGAYKTAFVSRNGRFVYKVGYSYYNNCGCDAFADWGECDHEPGEAENGSVIDEFYRANRLRAQGYAWAPPTTLYMVDDVAVSCQPVAVSCQPLYTPACDVAGDAVYDRLMTKAHALERRFLVNDAHDENYGMTAGGHLRFFDLG